MILRLSLGLGLQATSTSHLLVLSLRAHQRALRTMTWRGLINRKGILIGHWQVWALEPEDGYFLL